MRASTEERECWYTDPKIDDFHSLNENQATLETKTLISTIFVESVGWFSVGNIIANQTVIADTFTHFTCLFYYTCNLQIQKVWVERYIYA